MRNVTPASKISRCTQVHSEYNTKYKIEYVLKFAHRDGLNVAPYRTRRYTHRQLDCKLPMKLKDALVHTLQLALK
jgi:hypothetical protein